MKGTEQFRLDGEVALITGAGTGLGRAIATAMHAAGAAVVLVGRRHQPLLEVEEQLGPGALAVPADVTQQADIHRLINTVEARLGTVDTLVHCAGVHLKGPLLEVDREDERRLIETHLTAALTLTRALLPGMRARGRGCLLFIGSMAAVMGIPDVAAYSAAKGAVSAMTQALAVELGPAGVRVNVITPGWVLTPMTAAALDNDEPRRERILQRTPLGRFGRPEDVAAAAVYLASPAAAFVTGANLVVDGGAAVGF